MLAFLASTRLVILVLFAAAPAGAKGAAADLERGEKLFRAGDLTGALQAFDSAAKADGKDPRGPYLRGVVLEKKNDLAGAEKAYRDAVARDGKFAPAHNNLGAILLGRNELDAAEKEIQAALASDPKSSSAAFNLGLLREAQNQLREAAAAYRRALLGKPDDGTCHANLCAVLRKQNNLDGALDECRAAARLLPQNAVVLTNLGLLLSDKQQYDEARSFLHQATLADAKFAPAWSGLGRVELRRKQTAAAVAALAKAAKLAPKDAVVAADHCRALVEQDLRSKVAQDECRRAAALPPQNALAHYELLKILVAHGDCAGAKAQQEKLAALPAVKPQAKAQAEAILKTCVPGKTVSRGKK
jgi:Flp pilus assembly protein TadD